MSHLIRQEIMPDIFLNTIRANQFSSNLFGVQFFWPLEKDRAASLALLPHLLRRGSADYPDMARLNEALDRMYGARVEPYVRKKGETIVTGFLFDAIDDRMTPDEEPLAEELIRLVCGMLTRPLLKNGGFNPEWLSGEKQLLKDRIAGRINDKRTYAQRRMLSIMCADEPFSIDELGTPETVDLLTPEGVASDLRLLLEQARIELFCCGSLSHEKAAFLFKKGLSGLTRLPVRPLRTSPGAAPAQPRIATEHLDVTQGKLVMGFRTGITAADSRYPALMAANAVFGGSTGSKLFLHVRERLSLCYYASSRLDPIKGILIVSSGIDEKNALLAREEILRQLSDTQAGRISEDEWNIAISSLIDALTGAEDSPRQLEEFTLTQLAAESGRDLASLAEALRAVTPEQAAEAARLITLDTIYLLGGKEEAPCPEK